VGSHGDTRRLAKAMGAAFIRAEAEFWEDVQRTLTESAQGQMTELGTEQSCSHKQQRTIGACRKVF
jgi:hypothetical protein